MAVSRWIFTKEQILNTPSRKHGIDSDKELSYRQQAANLIQDMGQRLSVSQLCINTAIVYMHRFYMFQSFGRFPRNDMAPACLFLAAKVEEQPRKLEHVIRVAHACLHRDNSTAPDPQTEAYLEQAQIIVMNENILLQTLGFETSVDHPNSKVIETANLVKASKDLSQTSYFLATNSLHLTTFCLQYKPSTVACVCIYLASKWSNWKITRSNQGKEWYYYVDPTVTQELLEELCTEFLNIMDRGPNKLKKKIMGWKAGHREIYKSEEEKQQELRKQRAEQLQSTSADPSRPSASSQQHRHTNHDRKREHDPDRRDHSDRREIHGHPDRKEMGPNGDAHAVNAQPKREIHGERRDIPERREDRKDMNERRNAEIKGVHDRRDHVDKRDSVERKVSDIKKETAVGKDQEGKNIHRKDGERKEFIPGKDPYRQKHERNFLDAVIGRDGADSHSSIREKQESKPFQGERNDSSVHNTGHIPRTSQANQNVKSENFKSDTPSVKTETHASDQTSAKPEFVVPKLEKPETHPHRKEPVNSSTSSSNAAPKKVPVSLNLPPGVENRQSGLHKSKSEMTLNYKDYLQRKERERERQQLLEKQEKFNLNKSYTEGSQSSSKTNKHPNLDTSLPLKLQGNSEKVKQEMQTENRHGMSMKTGHEKEIRIKPESEAKMHHGAEAKPRKRSNSKSPGASKRSPRVHNTNSSKISPVKSSTDQSRGQVHTKSNKTETPHLKLQISNSENPPSPLKSPVKNIKEIPKSEPFVDLGEPLKTDGKKRRFSGPEIEKLTGIELENLKVKTDTTQHESVNNSASKENLKASQESRISETKDIIKDSAKIAVKQEPSEAKVRDSISKIKQEPDETVILSPLVQNKHPLKDVNVAKHSPLLHDKHASKDASIAKNSPALHNKHPLKDSSDAKQSPSLHNRHPPQDLNLVKQSPFVSSKPEHREMDRAKHSPVVAKKDIKDSISQQSPLVTVKQEKHSPLVPKKDFKESLSAKQSPVVTVQQENRDSHSARQSPLTVARSESPRIVVKPELKDSNISKQSPRVVVKQEVTENNIDEPDIQLKPEHSGLQPLKLHIKDPLYDTLDIMASKSSTPEVSASKTASPIPSLKISIKKEPGSGGNTPVKYKTEHSNGNTPLKLTIKQEPSIENPLKMKLKASHTGDEHRHDKHHRRHKEGHVHSGKHKHKHKSHKHKDREKDRERKHSKHSVEVTGSNGKPEIKIRMKLGQPPGAEGSSASTSQSGTYQISKHDKHKRREGAHVVPEIVSNSDDSERHQPWSVSELDPKSAAKQAAKVADSPSRKRRRAPTVDDGNDISMSQPHQKAAKMTSNRLRRSSSSHSIVSMEMSDNECGEDPDKANKEQLKALQIKLTQAIQFQKKVIDDRLKEQNVTGQKPVQPNYERQKSGFDLDLYCGDAVGTPPPLPQGNPPLPPTPPSSQTLSTPPPPPPL